MRVADALGFRMVLAALLVIGRIAFVALAGAVGQALVLHLRRR